MSWKYFLIFIAQLLELVCSILASMSCDTQLLPTALCYPQAQLAGAWALTASFRAPLRGQIPGKIYSLSKLEKLSLLTAELCWEDQGSSQRSRTPAVDSTCIIRILLRR